MPDTAPLRVLGGGGVALVVSIGVGVGRGDAVVCGIRRVVGAVRMVSRSIGAVVGEAGADLGRIGADVVDVRADVCVIVPVAFKREARADATRPLLVHAQPDIVSADAQVGGVCAGA